MKIPSFMRTIRFRLTLWYVAFLIFVVIALVIGLNVGVGQHVTASPQFSGTSSAPNPTLAQTNENDIRRSLVRFSIVGVAAAAVVGATGIYFLSGAMLKPIDKVTSLARRSSYSNLKERLNYNGPNDEIKRLADTFDDMLNRLNSAVDSQKQFIQDASHELRTPIATAVTNIEVLEMNSAATLTDYQELTGVLKLSLDRMNKISNSLQLLSEDAVIQTKWTQVNVAGGCQRGRKRDRDGSEKTGH